MFEKYSQSRQGRLKIARQFIAGKNFPGSPLSAIIPGNKLPGYFQISLREKISAIIPGNKLPGYFQISLREKS